MNSNKKQQWLTFLIVNSLPLLGILIFPLYKHFLAGTFLTSCKFYELTHLYCPGCGGTRSLNALLHFDIIDSIVYNPLVPFCALLFIIYDVTTIIYLIKGNTKPFQLKMWVIWTALAVWFSFALVRIILQLNGIDLLKGATL